VRAGLDELDHLATRMRRNAESLIILSGSEPARRWRGPIDLTEVVRASVREVKEHTRVELLPLDQVQLAGHAAADVMHLLAELIENAVTFSAPGTKALVAGQPLPAGYLLEIEDQGLGMTDEQLVKVNQRLAKPPDVDFALAKMLGFFVVTQLASKHGIRVQLRHSWYGGVTALVLLPRQLIVDPAKPPRSADGSAVHPADPDLDWSTAGCQWSTCRWAVTALGRRPRGRWWGWRNRPACSRPGTWRSGTGPGRRRRQSRSRCRSAVGPGTRAAC
jgi:histidine kinase/DNA gyrase B/HSP90-like ATPase